MTLAKTVSAAPSPKNFEEWLELRDLEDGHLWLMGQIDDSEVLFLSRRLNELIRRGVKEATLHITSPGGSVYSAIALYDTLSAAQRDGLRIMGLVEGYAASAASMIVLQAMDVRSARPGARILIHEPRRFGGVQRESDMEDDMAEMKSLSDRILEFMSRRSGKTTDELRKLFKRREVWFSAQQALEHGLLDEVAGA